MKLGSKHLLMAALCVLVGGAHAQTFLRKPFLQQGTPNSARVCWRLSEATSLTVKYGIDSTNLNLTTAPTIANANVCAVLTGLTPKTKYYYKVFDGANEVVGTPTQYLVTHPPVGDRGKHTFWLLGDPGSGATEQLKVKNGFLKKTGSFHVDGLILLGDQAYEQGTDAEFTSNYFNKYPEVISNSFAWATVGNHEGMTGSGSAHVAAYYLPDSAQSGGVASNSEKYYSWNYGNVHFICLDSETSDKTTGSAMRAWLLQDLQATTADWVVAYYHSTPYTMGHHNSDTETNHGAMRTVMQPLMEDYGLDFHFGGHSHLYERSYLLDSAYGTSTQNQANRAKQVLDSSMGNDQTTGPYLKNNLPHKGTVYIQAGSSGKLQTSGGSRHPMLASMQRLFGSTIMTIEDSVATIEWIDTTGTVRDRFQVRQVKGIVNVMDQATGKQVATQQKFTYSGRNFRFLPSNTTPFQVYGLDGKLLVNEVPQGALELKASVLPAGEYFYRYGSAYGKFPLQ